MESKFFIFSIFTILISVQSIAALLNCSGFTSNSSNATIAAMSWVGRLSACFAANPYDTSQPPLTTGGAPFVNVSYDYSVVYVISFDQGTISLIGQLSLAWPDEYRMWSFNQMPIYQIHVPLSQIWYPQFLFVSTIKKQSLKLLEPEDKAVLWPYLVVVVRKNVVEGHCDGDYSNFPFDTQHCSIDFAIDRYFFFDLDVVLSRLYYTYKLQTFINDEWTLLTVSHAPMNTSFTELVMNPNGTATSTIAYVVKNVQTGFQVNLTLSRHPESYITNVLTPIFVLTIVGQTAFAIPEHADSKVLVPLTVLIGFMFVQSIVATELPASSKPPIVSIYVLVCVVSSGASCIGCAICKWFASFPLPLPWLVMIVLVDGVGFVLFPVRWFQLGVRLWKRRCRRSPAKNDIPNAAASDTTTILFHARALWLTQRKVPIMNRNPALCLQVRNIPGVR